MKSIIVNYSKTNTEISLVETSLFNPKGKLLDLLIVPMNIEEIAQTDHLLDPINEKETPEKALETVQKCKLLFAGYIKQRIQELHSLHNLTLSFKKIRVASRAIQSCLDYESDKDLEKFKQNTIRIFEESTALNYFGGSSASVSGNTTRDFHKYPAGKLGVIAQSTFKAFNRKAYLKMESEDIQLKSASDAYYRSTASQLPSPKGKGLNSDVQRKS